MHIGTVPNVRIKNQSYQVYSSGPSYLCEYEYLYLNEYCAFVYLLSLSHVPVNSIYFDLIICHLMYLTAKGGVD